MKTQSSQTFQKKRKRQHFPIHSISPVTLIPKPKMSQENKTSTQTFIHQIPTSGHRRPIEVLSGSASWRQCVSASVRALQAQGLPRSSACPAFSPRPVPPSASRSRLRCWEPQRCALSAAYRPQEPVWESQTEKLRSCSEQLRPIKLTMAARTREVR